MKKLFLTAVIVVLGMMSSTSLMAFEAFIVKKITIEGNLRVSNDAVLTDLPISVGDQVTNAKVKTAIHDLFKTGFYQDVTIERDGDTLIVKLTDNIDHIVIGNSNAIAIIIYPAACIFSP